MSQLNDNFRGIAVPGEPGELKISPSGSQVCRDGETRLPTKQSDMPRSSKLFSSPWPRGFGMSRWGNARAGQATVEIRDQLVHRFDCHWSIFAGQGANAPKIASLTLRVATLEGGIERRSAHASGPAGGASGVLLGSNALTTASQILKSRRQHLFRAGLSAEVANGTRGLRQAGKWWGWPCPTTLNGWVSLPPSVCWWV